MKNFIKIFFIAFCFFASLSITGQSDNYFDAEYITQNINAITTTQSVPSGEILVKINENENSIASSNNQSHEISASGDKQNSYSNTPTDKILYQNKFSSKTFINKYTQLRNSISHKISPYLKNEICTRAP